MAFQPIYAIKDRHGRGTLLPYKQGVDDGSTLTLDFTTGVLDGRLTLTRGTNATFINSNGLVQYAASNQQIYSQDQSQSGTWVRQDINGVDANVAATADPQGGNTASKLRSAATLQAHLIYSTISTLISSGLAYTFSVYVKKAELKYVALHLASTARYTVVFDLDTGLMTTTNSTGTPLGTAYSSQDAGNGWWRLSATMITQTTTIYPHICLSNAANPGTNASGQPYYTGVLDDGVYTWGAQLNAGSTPLQYIATTTAQKFDQPRFDHDPTTLAPRGLLIEGQAVNLSRSSADLTDATYWTLQTAYSATSNTAGPSPDGTNNASSFTEPSTNLQRSIYQSYSSAAGTYTGSVWAKLSSGSTRYIRLVVSSGSGDFGYVTVNISTGAVQQPATNVGTATNASATVTAYPSGWYRITLTVTLASSINFMFVVPTDLASIDTPTTNYGRIAYLGNGTVFLLWGAQAEAGSGASSYIPTGASQGTRNADSCVMTGTNFSSWFSGATEGVLFAEFERPRSQSGNLAHDYAAVGTRYASGAAWVVYVGNSNFYPTTLLWPTGGAIFPGGIASAIPSVSKQAARWFGGNDATNFANGAQGTTGAGSGTLTPTMLSIGANSATGTEATRDWLNACVRRVKFWPVALLDSQIISLTT